MKVQFFCPKCGNEFDTPQRETGRKIPCPGCDADVIVPPPSYDMAAALSVLLYTAGGITIVVGLFILISTSVRTDTSRLLAAAGCVLGGLSIFGLAAIVTCVRDIARNTAFLHPMAAPLGADLEEELDETQEISQEDDEPDGDADADTLTDKDSNRPANQIRT